MRIFWRKPLYFQATVNSFSVIGYLITKPYCNLEEFKADVITLTWELGWVCCPCCWCLLMPGLIEAHLELSQCCWSSFWAGTLAGRREGRQQKSGVAVSAAYAAGQGLLSLAQPWVISGPVTEGTSQPHELSLEQLGQMREQDMLDCSWLIIWSLCQNLFLKSVYVGKIPF